MCVYLVCHVPEGLLSVWEGGWCIGGQGWCVGVVLCVLCLTVCMCFGCRLCYCVCVSCG